MTAASFRVSQFPGLCGQLPILKGITILSRRFWTPNLEGSFCLVVS